MKKEPWSTVGDGRPSRADNGEKGKLGFEARWSREGAKATKWVLKGSQGCSQGLLIAGEATGKAKRAPRVSLAHGTAMGELEVKGAGKTTTKRAKALASIKRGLRAVAKDAHE